MDAVLTRLPDEPIVIVKIRPTLDPQKEVYEIADTIADMFAEEEGPIYRINDFTDMDLPFGGLVMGLGLETQGRPGSLSDPRIKTVFVGTSEMVELGAKSARQEHYGGLDILLFATLEDALAHIRAERASDTGA